jgi:pilus assembly protein Flp/PilA
MNPILRRLRSDERGATAIEYGLIAALVVIAIIGAMGAFADASIQMWTDVGNQVASTTP